MNATASVIGVLMKMGSKEVSFLLLCLYIMHRPHQSLWLNFGTRLVCLWCWCGITISRKICLIQACFWDNFTVVAY